MTDEREPAPKWRPPSSEAGASPGTQARAGELERAIEALQAVEVPEGEKTLARILASVESARAERFDPIDEAAAALRNETFDADAGPTLGRIRHTLAARRDRRRALWAIAAASVLAIGLSAPSAWAWGAERWVEWAQEPRAPSRHAQAPVPPVPPAPARERSAPRPAVDVVPVVEVAPEPAVEPPSRAPRPRAVERMPLVPDADTMAFRQAHRAHFEEHDFELALTGWERYLADHPHGRYRLEASYNRALVLVRVGRLREAREALAPFADGEHRGYRQSEATSLVAALDARMAEIER